MIRRLAACIKEEVARDVVPSAEAVVKVEGGSRPIEEDVVLELRLARHRLT